MATQIESAVTPRAQSTKDARAERAGRTGGGLSRSRLWRVHDVLAREVDSGELPGLVTLISRRGEEHVDAIGALDFGAAKPMPRDAIFRLASMTKPITAVATMILVEECTLRLDDPIEAFLPELANRKVLRTPSGPLDDTVPAQRPITLRDLLTFRAGYGEVAFMSGMAPTPLQAAMFEARLPLAADWLFASSPDELMKRVGALPLAFQPGERWLYHLCADILGVLVARASGKSFATFLRERIFEPLGMRDTDFGVPPSKMDRFTTWYGTDPATGARAVHDPARGGLFSVARPFESGGGGLASTVDDLHAFARMMLGGGAFGGVRILSRPTLELMTTDWLTPEQKLASPFFPNFWDAAGWGLGLGVIARHFGVGRSAGAFGWDGAFGTSMWIDPREGLIGILMTQRSPRTLRFPTYVEDFWTAAYQAIDD